MQNRFLSKILPVIPLLLAVLGSSGCAVDNEFLAKMPLFEAKSDRIPGLLPPLERAKLIRAKGEKGAKAPDSEKEILVAQLMVEYRTSPDSNMRRESVDAMAKIPHPKRDEYMKEILKDQDPFVRISALEAVGKSYNGSQQELATILIDHLRHDPDKDVRIAGARQLATALPWKAGKGETVPEELRRRCVAALGETLYDKTTVIRYESMQALRVVTGKDYGSDINRWTQYVRYTKGEEPELPKERTFAEKLPSIHLPMLK